MLEAIAENIWVAEGPDVSFHGFPYPTRMVVVRLTGRDTWIWSPVRFTSELGEAVSRLGAVSHIVSPNKLHHLYLSEWHDHFPDAHLWGPKSTVAKRGDLLFARPLDDVPPTAWASEIDQAWFRGSPFMDEIVFFHRSSHTAIFADLIQAFSEEYLRSRWKPWQRLVIGHHASITLAGGGGTPIDWRLSFFNRRPARAARAKVVGWNPERVVIAHGTWQRERGRAFIERALSWLA